MSAALKMNELLVVAVKMPFDDVLCSELIEYYIHRGGVCYRPKSHPPPMTTPTSPIPPKQSCCSGFSAGGGHFQHAAGGNPHSALPLLHSKLQTRSLLNLENPNISLPAERLACQGRLIGLKWLNNLRANGVHLWPREPKPANR
ncbi:hypothetical protein AMECASPLE_001833 [Ameca splendens]|uniref:Uncharacterized protein n=1 Tax=Ameca splendens TaxID=208324 RepID=A0ABV1A4V1_9TELE